MRSRIWIALVVVPVIAAVGCSGGAHPKPARAAPSRSFNAARTSADGRELVLAYTSGDCDRSARATVRQTASTVTVAVVITGTGARTCDAAARFRFVVAHLGQPLGTRKVVDGATGAVVVPFDGRALLKPTWLPAGLGRGAGEGTNTSDRSWTQSFAVPPAPNGTCVRGPETVVITQGLGVRPPTGDGFAGDARHPLIDSRPASVTHQTNGGDITVTWTPAGRPAGWAVTVAATKACQGDPVTHLATLVRVARGLR